MGIATDIGRPSGPVGNNFSSGTTEGRLTRNIEEVTAKAPSMTYLGLAVGSMVASASIALFSRRKELANFVGLWAPSLLIIGLYNKLVKIEHELGANRNAPNV